MNWIYTHDLNPIALELGPLQIAWYGLMYTLSFLLGYILLHWQLRREGRNWDAGALILPLMLGVILGGRLGWVVFYGGMDYLYAPWKIFKTWEGGMSFHGGLLGAGLAIWLHARKQKYPLLMIFDTMSALAPLGLFFGRVGNFINGELYGKFTDGSWGVIFAGQSRPRHPSQLYEALLEGLLLFIILQFLQARNWKTRYPGGILACFLLGYSLFRMAVELVRLPDAHLGYLALDILTMGQLLSLPFLLLGLGGLFLVFSRARALATSTHPAPGAGAETGNATGPGGNRGSGKTAKAKDPDSGAAGHPKTGKQARPKGKKRRPSGKE